MDTADWFEAVKTNFDFGAQLALAMEYDDARQLSDQGDSEGAPVAVADDHQWDDSPDSSPPASPIIPADPEIGGGPPLTHKEKDRLAKRDRQRQKRRNKKAQMEPSDLQHRASQSEKYPSLKRVRVKTFTARSLPSTSNIFVGKTQTSSKTVRTLEEMLEENYTVVPWNGLWVSFPLECLF